MASVMTDGCAVGSGYVNNLLSEARNKPVPKTIGEVCDDRIHQARRHVEQLCIQKAKLEAMNLLNHPYVEMRDMINGEVF